MSIVESEGEEKEKNNIYLKKLHNQLIWFGIQLYPGVLVQEGESSGFNKARGMGGKTTLEMGEETTLTVVSLTVGEADDHTVW